MFHPTHTALFTTVSGVTCGKNAEIKHRRSLQTDASQEATFTSKNAQRAIDLTPRSAPMIFISLGRHFQSDEDGLDFSVLSLKRIYSFCTNIMMVQWCLNEIRHYE